LQCLLQSCWFESKILHFFLTCYVHNKSQEHEVFVTFQLQVTLGIMNVM
jgi:hypothetical protein